MNCTAPARSSSWLLAFAFGTSIAIPAEKCTAQSKPNSPTKIRIELSQSWKGPEFYIDGKTNLLDGTKLTISIAGYNEGWSDDSEAVVTKGRFRTKGFMAFENPVPLDRYTVLVDALEPGEEEADRVLETEMTLTAASRASHQAISRAATESEIRDELREMMQRVFGEHLRTLELSGPEKHYYNLRVDFDETGEWSAEDGECLTIACIIERKMRDAYQAIFTSNVKIGRANLVAYMPGRLAGPVYATVLDNHKASRIDWEQKNSLDFTGIWQTTLKDNRLE